jgi:hypothetical protein
MYNKRITALKYLKINYFKVRNTQRNLFTLFRWKLVPNLRMKIYLKRFSTEMEFCKIDPCVKKYRP